MEATDYCAPTVTKSSPNPSGIGMTGTSEPRLAGALILGKRSPASQSFSHYLQRSFSPISKDPTGSFPTKMHGSMDTRSYIQIGSSMKASRVRVSPNATMCLASSY